MAVLKIFKINPDTGKRLARGIINMRDDVALSRYIYTTMLESERIKDINPNIYIDDKGRHTFKYTVTFFPIGDYKTYNIYEYDGMVLD